MLYLVFTFLLCSFLERKLRKELCALWQFLFNFVRCPASGQLGIAVQRKALAADRQCLKQSLQRLQLTAYTTECATMCAPNPCTVLFSYEFHKQSIDHLIRSIFTVYGSKTYDTEGFSALGRFGRWAERSCKQAQGMFEVSETMRSIVIKFPYDTELPGARAASAAQSKS